MYKEFEKCTKMSKKRRKELLNHFFSQNLDIQLAHFDMQFRFYKEKYDDYDHHISYVCAFFRALEFKQLGHTIVCSNLYLFEEFNREKLSTFFKKQDIFVQIEVFKEQKNQFFKYKKDVNIQYLPLYAFYRAIDIFYQRFKIKFYKNKTLNLKSVKNIADINILKDKKQKVSIKRDRFLNYISIVKRLKNEGYSYRQMSLHFERYYKYNVSHTYLQKMYKEFFESKNGT